MMHDLRRVIVVIDIRSVGRRAPIVQMLDPLGDALVFAAPSQVHSTEQANSRRCFALFERAFFFSHVMICRTILVALHRIEKAGRAMNVVRLSTCSFDIWPLLRPINIQPTTEVSPGVLGI